MKAFVINLDSRPDRWASVESELRNVLELERVPAVKGAELDLAALPLSHRACSSIRVGKTLKFSLDSSGAVGCAMSHRAAWQRVVDSGLEGAVVLEDDASLVVSHDQLRAMLQQISGEFTWLQVFKGNPTRLPGWVLTQDSSKNGSHAYYISASAARKMLQQDIFDLSPDYLLQACFQNAPVLPCFKQRFTWTTDIAHPPGEDDTRIPARLIFCVAIVLVLISISFNRYFKSLY